MPRFTTEPPIDPRGHALQLIRTPPFKPFVAIATSSQLIGCPTHFWHGRTVPCEETECDPCQNNMPWRWHGWIACFTAKPSSHVLFEFTKQAADAFVEYYKAHKTLRGCHFTAIRNSKRPNGRVTIATKQMDLTEIRLPEEPNLRSALSIIWNISSNDIVEDGILRDVPRMKINDTNVEIFKPREQIEAGNGRAPK